VTGPSFRKSAENLERLGQITVSSTRLRLIVENEGRQAIRCRDKKLIRPDWDVSDCKMSVDGPTRIMVGSDGVMVPLITQSEKQKRRKNRRPRRRKKAKGQTAIARKRRRRTKKPKRCRGADNPYKEFKIATFYSQDHANTQSARPAITMPWDA